VRHYSYSGKRDHSWETSWRSRLDTGRAKTDTGTEFQIALAITSLGVGGGAEGGVGLLRSLLGGAGKKQAAEVAEETAPAYARNAYKRLTPGERDAALEKAPVCVYCGQRPSNQADHVEALKADWYKRGWKDTRDVRSGRVNQPTNVTGACQPCNGSKGAKELGEGAGQWWPSGWSPGQWWPFGR